MSDIDKEEVAKSWVAYRIHVLNTLESFDIKIDTLIREVAGLKTEIALLKFKTGLIAASISTGGTAIISVIVHFLTKR